MSTKIDARTTFFFLKLSGLEPITSCASAARFTTVSTKGIEYEAWVGCDSEFHAYGDHQTDHQTAV